ncbi:glycosyltransferase family 4 protein [Tsukamurella pseudospumae]|uniref:glycosyltransferase family 4 protein n=1 Tax=Tsukamurella pseudospumae TaxID=239498 RepID=UPI0009E7B09F|nr:glycosyltransferase family 1 protein [Tsukamurella pseudospumae]
MIRVALDARRQRDNGVARVTRLVATALSLLPIRLVLLGPVEELRDQFPEAELVPYDPPLLSLRDLYGLSTLLDTLDIDCFVAPQFYNSPWTKCPQVRILHDTFPLEPGARLPGASDAERAFGVEGLRGVSAALLGSIPSEEHRWAADLYRAYYDLAVKNAAVVLTVSSASRSSLERHFPETIRKIEVLPLAPDPSLVSTPIPIIAERANDIIHVSKFEPRKNQLTMLDAWGSLADILPRFRACMVGSPSTLFSDYGAKVSRSIERGQANGWLEYHTAIDDIRLGEFYRASKILCAPSTAEGFGLPALEGLANGCAVIARPGTAIDEICGAEAVHADSAGSIANAVAELLADPDSLQQRSVSGLRHASKFTVERTAGGLMNAIDQALDVELPRPLARGAADTADQDFDHEVKYS